MIHVRKALREAVRAKLQGLTIPGSAPLAVFTTRGDENNHGDMPFAIIVTNEEASERADKSGDLQRTITLGIGLCIDADVSEGVDDEMDAWALAVETALQVESRAMTLVRTTAELSEPEEGERWFGYLTLEYEAIVFGLVA